MAYVELVKRSFPGWSQKPIPGLSLSASGLVALADLSTVAQRTAITGTSSWLDALLVAPGLHYQQAAESLVESAGAAAGRVYELDGQGNETPVEPAAAGEAAPPSLRIQNAATIHYIQKVARAGEVVIVDVGVPSRGRRPGSRIERSQARAPASSHARGPRLHGCMSLCDGHPGNDLPDLGWVAQLLYLASPVLTVAAVVLDVLLQDWWAVGLLLALMLSRILNILVIKRRTSPAPETTAPPARTPATPDRSLGRGRPAGSYDDDKKPRAIVTVQARAATTANLGVTLPDGRRVCLRGRPADVQAITTGAWLRPRTHVEGYLEAAAKVVVYLVAALSGNQTQAGAIVNMCLLLSSAGLLALSNAHAADRGVLKMKGRTAARTGRWDASAGGGGGPVAEGGYSAPCPSRQHFASTEHPSRHSSSGPYPPRYSAQFPAQSPSRQSSERRRQHPSEPPQAAPQPTTQSTPHPSRYTVQTQHPPRTYPSVSPSRPAQQPLLRFAQQAPSNPSSFPYQSPPRPASDRYSQLPIQDPFQPPSQELSQVTLQQAQRPPQHHQNQSHQHGPPRDPYVGPRLPRTPIRPPSEDTRSESSASYANYTDASTSDVSCADDRAEKGQACHGRIHVQYPFPTTADSYN